MEVMVVTRRTRVPAPAVPVLLVARGVGRVVSRRRKRASVAARDARLVDTIEARVGSVSVPVSDPVAVARATVEAATVDTGDGAVSDSAPVAPRVSWRFRVRSWVWRRRRDTLAPLAVSAGVVVVWVGSHAVPSWRSLPGCLAVAGPVSVFAAGVWWALQVDPRGVSPWTRRVAWLTVAVGAGWVLAPLSAPLGPWRVGVWPPLVGTIPYPWWVRWVLLAVWTAMAVWFRRRRFAPRPEAVTAPRGPAEVWNDTLAGPRRACQGNPMDPATVETVVSPATGEPIGWRAEVICPPGTTGAPAIAQAVNQIATTFHVDPTQVELLGSHSRPIVQVIERTPFIDRSQPWTPGGYSPDGTIVLGTYPDGAPALGQLHKPGEGVLHGWVSGGTGSGKSGVLNGVMGRAMESGLCVLDVADLGENSLPAWRDVAFRHGRSVADASLALCRANALINSRRRLAADLEWTDRDGNKRVGMSTLPIPGPWPIYLVVIDEWPELLQSPTAMKAADRVGRLGRKFGVSLLLASQGASLNEVFKGCEVLRQNVQQGNIIGLRSDGTAGRMVFAGAISADLSRLPKGNPGLGYLSSPAASRSTRFRALWIDEGEGRPEDVPSPWAVAGYAKPAKFGPGDEVAIAKAEADAKAGSTAGVTQLRPQGPRPQVTLREVLHRVLPDLCKAGRSVSTQAIAAVTAQHLGVTEDDKKNHYDRVRRALDAAMNDDESPVTKTDRGQWGWNAA